MRFLLRFPPFLLGQIPCYYSHKPSLLLSQLEESLRYHRASTFFDWYNCDCRRAKHVYQELLHDPWFDTIVPISYHCTSQESSWSSHHTSQLCWSWHGMHNVQEYCTCLGKLWERGFSGRSRGPCISTILTVLTTKSHSKWTVYEQIDTDLKY